MAYTGGQIIMEYLKKEEVPYILGIPGHGCLGLFDAVKEAQEKQDIQYLQVKHEQSAVHMADGYYRATGEPLAVFTSIGPGALNTSIGLANAYVDSIPVLVLTGDAHTHMRGVGVLQEIERHKDSDFLSAMEPITKRCWRVESLMQLPKIIQRSFNYMLTGRKGPVVVSLPMDVQSDAIETPIPEPSRRRTDTVCSGDMEAIEQAAKLMESAKRPVIIAGGGVSSSGAFEEIKELAEKWGAAVVTTMMGKSCFPENHPQYAWHAGAKGTSIGNEICRKADVVLALGVRFADETTSSYKKGVSFSFPETKLIHVDMDPHEIGKNYPCHVGILGDIKKVLGQLVKAYNKGPVSSTYLEEIISLRQDWKTYLQSFRSKNFSNITLSQFIGEMNNVLPDESILVTSSGNSQAQIFQEYCTTKPKTHISAGGFSTMGFAFPAAMGVKLGKPDTPVIAVVGDGDFMMTMQELSTAVQYNIPVVIVLINNQGWLAIKDLQMAVYGEDRAFGNDFIDHKGELYSPNYQDIAKGFGMKSIKISKKEEVKNAFEEAIGYGAPVLIEVDVCREYPYSGGNAMGWWDVPVPTYLEEERKQYEEDIITEELS